MWMWMASVLRVRVMINVLQIYTTAMGPTARVPGARERSSQQSESPWARRRESARREQLVRRGRALDRRRVNMNAIQREPPGETLSSLRLRRRIAEQNKT